MKRFLDVFVSLFTLFALFPVILIVAILIRIKLGSPVLFIQNRPGQYGDLFNLIKFRTMLEVKNKHGDLLPDSDRMTKFGSFLRSTSLDELPGLINVLKGDMSLIGPRPLLAEYLPLYSIEQAKRHDIRPGITGWAQVNGRNAISWEEKLNLDVWYVNNQSTWLDIKILWLTIKKVMFRENISANGDVTMPKFTGTQK